jgi:hypothetical protein
MMIKEFVWGRKLSEASLPEDTEVKERLMSGFAQQKFEIFWLKLWRMLIKKMA